MNVRVVRLWTAIGAVVVAGAVVLLGYGIAHGLVAGTALALVVLAAGHLGLGERVELPRLPYDNRSGSRLEVSSISWSLYGRDGMTAEGRRHLRRLLLRVLAARGIDADEAAGRERADRLLGADVVRFATDPASPAPDARRVRAIVLTLETLEDTP